MNKKQLWGVVAIAVVLILGLLLGYRKHNGQLAFGTSGAGYSSVHYNQLVPTSTLSNSYSAAGSVSSSRIAIDGYPNVVLSGTYTPASYGSIAYILIQRSVDGGATYKPYVTITPEQADVLINTSGSSTSNGTPFLVPGNGLFTSASGTNINFSLDLTMVADFIKVQVKENTTSTAGTMSMQLMAGTN